MACGLNKWRHPKTDVVRIYLNGLEKVNVKVWFERGLPLGSPAIHKAVVSCDQQLPLKIDELEEVSEALEDLGLDMKTMTWEKLVKEASW